MADQLYLSLWFPDFRLDSLPSRLISVMRQFALIAGPEGQRVRAAAAYPISFSEPATWQRLFVTDDRAQPDDASTIEAAVAQATEHLHDDMAYEFELKWRLWTPDSGSGPGADLDPSLRLDTLWRPLPTTVRILGFGPNFDDAAFEQNGHIRVDFGLDYPWVLDQDPDDPNPGDDDDDSPSNLLAFRSPGHSHPSGEPGDDLDQAATHIRRNVEMLLAFTLSVEKNCGISSRLLWTESGEPLAEKLIARLQRLH